MISQEINNRHLEDKALMVDMLKAISGYEDLSEDELCNIIESIKEFTLLLSMLSLHAENPENGS